MFIVFLAFGAGGLASLRAFPAAAILSWAARLNFLPMTGTWLAFLGARQTPWIFTLLALTEMVLDKVPGSPHRTSPLPFGLRLLSGAVCGAAITVAHGNAVPGAAAGLAGAAAGTLLSAGIRRRLARSVDSELPLSLLEDAVAVFGGLGILSQLF